MFNKQLVDSYKEIVGNWQSGKYVYSVVYVCKYEYTIFGDKHTKIKKSTEPFVFSTQQMAEKYAQLICKPTKLTEWLECREIFPNGYEVVKPYGSFMYWNKSTIAFIPKISNCGRIEFQVLNDYYHTTNMYNCDYIKYIIEVLHLDEIAKGVVAIVKNDGIIDSPSYEDLLYANKEINELKKCIAEYKDVTQQSRELIDKLNENLTIKAAN